MCPGGRGDGRYPSDNGYNLALAHASCNNDKSDLLAAVGHLESWLSRNHAHESTMACFFEEHGLLGNLEASEAVASWAYGQTEATGGSVWLRRGMAVEQLNNAWRRLM